jgi:hypothetical protein
VTLFRPLAVFLLCWLPLAAVAGTGPGDKVEVTLVVILAAEEGEFVDPRLRAIAAEVRKLNPSLTSFRLKEMVSKSLPPGERTVFPLVENRTAEILVTHAADKQNRVGVAVTPPGQGEIEYRTVCGKFLPIITRQHTRAKERLILAIRVQPCEGD